MKSDSLNDGALRSEIKRLIVAELHLAGRDPDSIDDDAPLFGGELGLDSLDALQLAMSLEERLAVRVPEGDEGRAVMRTVRGIADHVAKVRGE